MISKSKQKRRIVEYMRKYGSITNMKATSDLHIGSPTKVISDLKKDGYIFNKKRIECVDRDGDKCFYIEYSIAAEPEVEYAR